MTSYALETTLTTGFDEAVTRTRDALAEQGFGVLTEIDVAATMKTKLDLDGPPHLILGACNPALAHAALSVDPHIGLLLPCNVTIRRLDADTVEVAAMNPDVLVSATGNPGLAEVATQARTRLQSALDTLADSRPLGQPSH